MSTSPLSKAGPRSLRGVLALSAGIILLAMCFAYGWPAAAAEQVTENGVLHVKNGATPSQGIETMQLEEAWRAGGEDDEDVLFGLIAQALVDDDNNIYLLDSQLSHIEVFSPTGEHLKTLGGEGSGPGEFTRAFDMVFMPDGSLGVVQIFPGKIIKIALDGTPAGEYKPALAAATEGGFLVLINALSNGKNLVLTGIDMSFNQETLTQTRRHFIKSFDAEGKPLAGYDETERVWSFQGAFTLKEAQSDYVWGRIDVGPDGKVVAAIPRDSYAVTVFNPDGSIDRVIDREYAPFKRTERSRARATAQFEGQLRQLPPGSKYELEDNEPDVMGIHVHPDGTIWVLTSRSMWEPKPGVLKTYDVFSPTGEFVKQVDIKGEGSSSNDLLLFARGDLVFQITGFYDAIIAATGGASQDTEEEPEAMSVICNHLK